MGLKAAGRGDAVEASWEGIEVLSEGAVILIVVPTEPLVPVVSSLIVVTDPAKEAGPGLEEEEIT